MIEVTSRGSVELKVGLDVWKSSPLSVVDVHNFVISAIKNMRQARVVCVGYKDVNSVVAYIVAGNITLSIGTEYPLHIAIAKAIPAVSVLRCLQSFLLEESET